MNIYAVSDATGDLAVSVTNSALRQFKQDGVLVLRRARIRTPERVAKTVREAKENNGFIVFTFVAPDLRNHLLRLAEEAGVPAFDVMGPLMEQFAQFLHKKPSDEPGLQYQINNDYFRRSDSIEFAVKHDDGQGADTIHQADIVLLGISRTSKTPLSIYLAYRGYKTANVPIVRHVPIPHSVFSVDPRKMVGLTISAEKLVELRGTRLVRLGRPLSEDYANIDSIRQEMSYASRIFAQLGSCPVIDVTGKAIEEIASEILSVLSL